MNDKRQIHKDIIHAIDHLENGSIEFALNLLKAALQREEAKVRGSDNNR